MQLINVFIDNKLKTYSFIALDGCAQISCMSYNWQDHPEWEGATVDYKAEKIFGTKIEFAPVCTQYHDGKLEGVRINGQWHTPGELKPTIKHDKILRAPELQKMADDIRKAIPFDPTVNVLKEDAVALEAMKNLWVPMSEGDIPIVQLPAKKAIPSVTNELEEDLKAIKSMWSPLTPATISGAALNNTSPPTVADQTVADRIKEQFGPDVHVMPGQNEDGTITGMDGKKRFV